MADSETTGAGAASVQFAVGTLLDYDALNMPSAFWSDGAQERQGRREEPREVDPRSRTVLRPPSEDTVLLVNVWNRFFVPALVLSVAAVSCFLLTWAMSRQATLAGRQPGPGPSLLPSSPPALPAMDLAAWLHAVGALLASTVVVWPLYRRWGPRLGGED